MIHSFIFSQKEGRLISQDISPDMISVFLMDEGVQFWVDVGGVSDEEARLILDGVFHFHPLAIEDCLTPSERPKVDEYEQYVFMVIHAVDFSHSTHEFQTTELNLFIGKNYLVTFHRDPLPCVNATIDRIQKNAPAVARAPDRLTYTLLDFLLENYEPALEKLTTDIEEFENDVVTNPSEQILNKVIRLKTEVQKLRHIVEPQRDVISRLARGEFKIVRSHMLPYYRDLLDQLVRIATMADNYRDSVSHTLEIYAGIQQVQLNRVMKFLTVLATFSLPILIVSSFYGMNINHWPTFQYTCWEAYGFIFSITGLMTVSLYLVLKRKRWW